MKKLIVMIVLMALAAPAVANTPSPGSGFEDYICHYSHGWLLCKVRPGKSK